MIMQAPFLEKAKNSKSKQNKHVTSIAMRAGFVYPSYECQLYCFNLEKANAAKPVLPTVIDHWNENGSLTRAYSQRKLKKLFSIKSLIAMITILIVERATTRKIFDLILCYLVLQCIV